MKPAPPVTSAVIAAQPTWAARAGVRSTLARRALIPATDASATSVHPRRPRFCFDSGAAEQHAGTARPRSLPRQTAPPPRGGSAKPGVSRETARPPKETRCSRSPRAGRCACLSPHCCSSPRSARCRSPGRVRRAARRAPPCRPPAARGQPRRAGPAHRRPPPRRQARPALERCQRAPRAARCSAQRRTVRSARPRLHSRERRLTASRAEQARRARTTARRCAAPTITVERPEADVDRGQQRQPLRLREEGPRPRRPVLDRQGHVDHAAGRPRSDRQATACAQT